MSVRSSSNVSSTLARKNGIPSIGLEHVNRRFKIFRILAERYRNRRRRYGLRCNFAALYNDALSLEA